LSIFAGRLLQLQGFDPNSYATAAADENRVTVTLPAERGDILDRNGKPLADSIDGEMVIADPALTSDHAPALATLLSNELGIDYFTTLEKLQKPDSRFQYIARRVPAATADKAVSDAEAKGYAGLTTERDPVREYPQGDVAANMIGFMGTDGPLAGLERTFNKQLAGTDGTTTYESDSAGDGTKIPLGQSSETPPVDGTNLHLTIDSDLQWYVQHVLMQAVEEHHADSGIAAVMDTKTGQVLSLADYPTYDASDPTASPASHRGIPSMTNVYEPGSVEKVLTLSSLIDAGKATDRTKIVVPPEIVSGGAPIHDWFSHGTLHFTLAGVIAQSSNLGTIVASNKFAPGQLRKYLVKFGLGQRTDVGIGGESPGILPSKSQWTAGDEDRIDFGQSLSVNALQELTAINAVANHGVYVSPSIIQGSATTDTGQQVGTAHTTTHRVVSANAAHQMELMMQRVVDPTVGLAPAAQVPGYLVAGKTGTAQNANSSCGCYDGTFTVSFAGFAPADNPRFTVYVVLHNPKDGTGGGSGAGPVFSKIMSFALRRYGVPPTTTKPSTLPTTW